MLASFLAPGLTLAATVRARGAAAMSTAAGKIKFDMSFCAN